MNAKRDSRSGEGKATISVTAPGGMIAFNVTNQFFSLVPLFATLAKDLSLEGYFIENVKPTEPYGFAASWVVLSPSFAEEQRQHLGKLRWKVLQDTGGTVWTDQYSMCCPIEGVFERVTRTKTRDRTPHWPQAATESMRARQIRIVAFQKAVGR